MGYVFSYLVEVVAANDHLPYRHFNLVRVLVRDSRQLRGLPGKETNLVSRVCVWTHKNAFQLVTFSSHLRVRVLDVVCSVFLVVGATDL